MPFLHKALQSCAPTLGRLSCAFAVLTLLNCARAPLKSPDQALRLYSKPVDVSDDLDARSLLGSLADTRDDLRRDGPRIMRFGNREISSRDYALALDRLLTLGQNDTQGMLKALRDHFDAYEVYGQDNYGEVFLTGYFEPEISGSRVPDTKHSYPLLQAPSDLVEVDLPGYKGFALYRPAKDKEGRARIESVPEREGIETKTPLLSKPLVYVDPIDAFFLHIQGSGTIRLKQGGDMRVGYAGANSQPYVAIGKFVGDKIPKEQLTLFTLEQHVRALPQQEAQILLRKNPSYVFFKTRDGEPITSSGVKAWAGRTLATDSSLFPKGALALLEFDRPAFKEISDSTPSEWKRARRLVFDHDTGGAIKGPGRADLFFGKGQVAKQSAGVIKSKARLLYFVPKQEWLQQIVAKSPLS